MTPYSRFLVMLYTRERIDGDIRISSSPRRRIYLPRALEIAYAIFFWTGRCLCVLKYRILGSRIRTITVRVSRVEQLSETITSSPPVNSCLRTDARALRRSCGRLYVGTTTEKYGDFFISQGLRYES